MSITKEDLEVLSRPFTEEQIGIKVQSFSKDKTKAMLIAYVQHTDAYTRIEQVDPAWATEITQVIPSGNSYGVRVKVTIKGVSRENGGEGEDLKSAISDAIKRAAMLFGVGRYLYDADSVWVPYSETADKFKKFTYQDYLRAARPGQHIAPTSKPTASVSTAAKATAPASDIDPPRDKKFLSNAIFTVAKKIKLDTKEMNEWIFDEFKKSPGELTLDEMTRFLEILQAELGAKQYA